jgi:hypothetical protein
MQALLSGSEEIGVRTIARLHLTSGTWGASDHDEDWTWNSLAYKGFGPAFRVNPNPATVSGRPQPGNLQLSATDPVVLSTFFAETYRNQLCEVGFVVVNNATGYMEELLWSKARLDAASIEIGEQKAEEPDKPAIATLTCTLAPFSADIGRPGVRTRSDQDQRLHRDTNDGFFKDVGVAAKTQINWGIKGPSSPASTLGNVSGTVVNSVGGASAIMGARNY